jgi:CMP-N-acetylneuraminic acid synthetase
MKNKKDICVIVQARLSSERVPKKMVRPFAGTTLFDIACKKLQNLSIDSSQCYVSVYEEELKQIAKKYDIQIYERSKESAGCDKGLQLMYGWWDKLPYKYVILVEACQPFLSVKTINKFIDEYIKSDYEGMFTVSRVKDYFWNKEGVLQTPWPEGQDLLNTKAVEPTLKAVHSIRGSRMDCIGNGIFMGSFKKLNDPYLFVVDENVETLDINYEWEFKAWEILYKYREEFLLEKKSFEK